MGPTRALYVGSLVACLLLIGVMARLTAFPILDTAWLIDSEGAYRLLGGLSEDQMRAYETVLKVDFAFALAYPMLFVLTFRYYAAERLGSRRLFLALVPIPVLASLFDLLENARILAMMGALPETIAAADHLGLVTATKWVMVFAATATVVVLAVFVHVAGPRSPANEEPDPG